MKTKRIHRFGMMCLMAGVVGLAIGMRSAAGKKPPTPPWMQDVVERGNTTYRMPKDMKKKKVGAQWVVEDLHEYVARRIYEMSTLLETRLNEMKERQEAFEEKTLNRIRQLEKDVEALKAQLPVNETAPEGHE